jgi:hypothetical protein
LGAGSCARSARDRRIRSGATSWPRGGPHDRDARVVKFIALVCRLPCAVHQAVADGSEVDLRGVGPTKQGVATGAHHRRMTGIRNPRRPEHAHVQRDRGARS